jgi:hypothetical protein
MMWTTHTLPLGYIFSTCNGRDWLLTCNGRMVCSATANSYAEAYERCRELLPTAPAALPFLPKDRDGALRMIVEHLHKVYDERRVGDSDETLSGIANVLDLIERS